MVYLSHNWGMGDSDCMPCFEPVDVHHRTRTNSTAGDTVHEHRSEEHALLINGTLTGGHQQPEPAINGHRKVTSGHLHLSVELSPTASAAAAATGGSVGLVKSAGSLSNKKKSSPSEGSEHHLLRKPLTPAASEDHHDSDYDEISIHPLSNQVSFKELWEGWANKR